MPKSSVKVLEYRIPRWDLQKLSLKVMPYKAMIQFGIGLRFHHFKYSEVGFFSIFLDVIIKLRSSLQKYVEKH